ncbi:3-oxoacyl-ACP reductase [Kocuria rhizophila]|uniref:3-oxoacyl-ACP reductase n=1 Tax=Kocuria rhizophila TaxID=72000 RepID=UPI00057ED591|nr:3-oxoacyl-ACP reductase [Kocuria rhizophila]KIC65763.1 3-ketoacyl-ACP reductase [Kocuria rhizophila]
MRIENTIVLVTGGARGLGEHLSRAFAREGARVLVNYHSSEERARALVSELGEDRALAAQADVTDAQQVRDMVTQAREHFGAPITVAVNNALVDFSFNGDARPTLERLTAENLTQQFQGAVVGALNVMQAVTPGMAEVGEGRIINIGTNLFQNPVVPYHDYTAAKAALLSLTRTAAKDLGPQGITVNMISGGLLRTTDASAATPDEVFDFIAAGTPLGRVTTPEEFADTALFFASDWSRGVTGQNLVVDGGLVMD